MFCLQDQDPPPKSLQYRCSKLSPSVISKSHVRCRDPISGFSLGALQIGTSPPAPSEMPETNPFPLLRLPPELRNLIYQFALSEPGSLRYHHDKHLVTRAKLYASQNAADEFNQLKFVSRQMYMETAGLELRYNDLHFPFDQERSLHGVHMFLSFRDICSPIHQSWIRSVTIEDGPLKQFTAYLYMHFIHTFAKYNPKAMVRIIFRWFRLNSDNENFICHGIFLKMLARNADITYLVPRIRVYLQMDMDGVLGQALIPAFRKSPANVKFFPHGSFDEHDFRHSKDAGEVVIHPQVEGGIDTWVSHARDWFENGI
ncbi:uncharacterized protein BDR25DRAFT_365582 [Lindgomyces ingoldianus]|uniref:Uncharacterized protein n=1 Tax=Lindgomyces ingoldianus TaxID=673940 RepID=A0ACB6RGL7_9PLEO|nr:uncharacterized protein BDR25DRAFT_365582 [Lindgomyces ingoldianus]KAF2478366.1 hypothetical protein BDR25DRAFT_365582 [Lindgomyces ingoldianus]